MAAYETVTESSEMFPLLMAAWILKKVPRLLFHDPLGKLAGPLAVVNGHSDVCISEATQGKKN